MRAILLNDTRSEPHVGCHLVVNNLLAECERVGIDVVDTHANARTDDTPYVASRLDDIDLVLINGEGTMHHDCPKAIELGRAAQAASSRGKTVVLLNTVWQANRQLDRYLRSIDLVFCRESRSAESVHAAGGAATVVPDLVLATKTERIARYEQVDRRGTVIVDSVDRHLAVQLAWFALRHGHSFLTMHEASWRRIRRRPWLGAALRWRSGQHIWPGTSRFTEQLARYELACSGRFHGVCLCMLLGIPVLGVASNTHKIEGLMYDAGVGTVGLISANGLSTHQLVQRLRDVRERQGEVRRYVQDAKVAIRSMFDTIAATAAANMAA